MAKIKGQSLVELALVMPILVILLAGLAEIGWYAYHYITLQEATRTIARTATTLYGDFSPTYWEDPDNGLSYGSIVEQSDSALRSDWLLKYRNCKVDDPSARIGFYNLLGCIGLQTINPLRTERFEPGSSTTDDIIISGFSIVPDDDKMKVTHRYPTNASECVPDDLRSSLGFVWGGNYRNANGCLGSSFSVEDVEQRINLDGFGLGYDMQDELRYTQPIGLILVEIHWEHETLTQFVGLAPVLSPVLATLGVSSDIYTWAAFPLPQVENS